MPKQNGSIGHDQHGFPRLEVIILVLCVTVNSYTLVNLFPYVGIMVMQLLGLESINEAGEARVPGTELKCHETRGSGGMRKENMLTSVRHSKHAVEYALPVGGGRERKKDADIRATLKLCSGLCPPRGPPLNV